MLQIHFSPAGTTKMIVNRIAAVSEKSGEISLMKEPPQTVCSKDEPVIVGMPVFADRIPVLAKQRLKNITGNQTPAIAVVVYGNRAYEDALLELKNELEKNCFTVVGAAAFVAKHSLFPEIAADRPNQNDFSVIDSFADKIWEKLAKGILTPVHVPGHFPYKEATPASLIPAADNKCVKCGVCARACPAFAIPASQPFITEPSKCISCSACVHVCPVHSRGFQDPLYAQVKRRISEKCTQYHEPETFI